MLKSVGRGDEQRAWGPTEKARVMDYCANMTNSCMKDHAFPWKYSEISKTKVQPVMTALHGD